MEVTKTFAEFVVQTPWAEIPAEERRLAGEAMLDGLGTALAAVSEPAGQMIIDYVRDLGGKDEATVIGAGFKTNAANAAYANGTLGHCLDFDDVGGFGHPTVVLLPAILAVGERLGKSGRDALEAYCIGFEVAVNLKQGYTRQNPDEVRGFHSTAVFGHFAATAAVARLMGLDVEQTRRAFGLAGSSAAGLCANFGYYTKPLHAGQTCRNAVTAVDLAARGWTAAPDIIERKTGYAYAFFGFENFSAEKATAGLGKEWRLPSSLGIKKYPCCFVNHTPLDALLGVLRENSVGFDDVESAELEVAHVPPFFREQALTGFMGKFNYEFNLAAAILDQRVAQDSFTDEQLARPRMQEALGRVRVVERPEKFTPETQRTANVTVQTKSGRTLTNTVRVPYGHAEDPLSHAELVAKFRTNAERLLVNGNTDRLLALMENLESAPIAEITAIAGARALARV